MGGGTSETKIVYDIHAAPAAKEVLEKGSGQCAFLQAYRSIRKEIKPMFSERPGDSFENKIRI